MVEYNENWGNMMLPSYFMRKVLSNPEEKKKFFDSLDKKIRNYDTSIKNKK